MSYKNFYVNVIVRVFILTFSIFLLLQSFKCQYVVAPVCMLGFSIFQVVSLIRFVNKTNRDLTNFLESMRFSEFSQTFSDEGYGASFEELNRAFNNVIKDFQQVRFEKEINFHYLQNIVQNIDVSILAYSSDGEVDMVNKAAKKLFQINQLKNLNALAPLSQELVDTLLSIKAGQNALVKVQDEDDILQLAIFATILNIDSKQITLVTIKNIQNVLEEQETEAWQKLIRVLTHEIMNSITPIASLSESINSMLKSQEGDTVNFDKETIDEIGQAIQTINKRSTGLLHFVNTYRNLTKIPKPNFQILRIEPLLKNIEMLMEDELKHNHVVMEVSVVPENIEVSMDEQLIEQVLINLIKNAIHALEKRPNPKIEVKAFFNKRGRVTLQVADNGTGILKEVLDKIFIPFFTTKTNGSGIGLSLSKQIIKLHNGSITATSIPEMGTTFTITF
jgi:two-component system, NtrC family, nitrogen regulation sensor histidine kinase NtrY